MVGDGGLGRSSIAARISGLGAALALAAGLTLAPGLARPAAAASGTLLVSAAATYTVDPSAGVVHVAVAVTLTNDRPSDASYVYYWRDISWGVQPEAVNIRARDGTGNLRVTPTAKDGFIDAEIRLRRNLNYRQTAKVTITWDLPGGEPRSASTIRVGEAFAAFDVWAWGDSGKSSVTASLPAGFEVQTFGSDLIETAGPKGVTLSATSIGDPFEFWAAVSGTRERSLTTDELTLPGAIKLVIKGWPEDSVWRTKVSNTLRLGLPVLQDLIGLPWPVTRRLEVSEVYAPLLEGYAGFFYTDEQRIEISEELDEPTIVHEGSHAWFNDSLFTDRWITEGLAETYAAAVLVELGSDRQSPDIPRGTDAGRVDLLSWQFPGRLTDESEAREQYGYNTSWYVLDTLYAEVGPEKFRAIFKAANASTIAYVGSGAPETVSESDNWRRFLDLVEEIGGSTKAEALYREFVATPTADRELDARSDARVAYDGLQAAGGGWAPPIYVRAPMGTWRFQHALDRIEEATTILDLRDEVAVAARSLGLEPPESLESAYEASTDGFESAEAVGAAELKALTDLASARDALAIEPDLVASVGLLGWTPGVTWDEAAALFESGQFEAAADGAAAALAVVEDAPGIGRERLTTVAAGVGTIVGFVVVLFAVRRRRLVRAAAAVQASIPTAMSPALRDAAGGSEPYATLAADPPAVPPEPVANPEQDGGSVGGDGSNAAP